MDANDHTSRTGTALRRGTVMLPAILLSAAWTSSVAGVGSGPAAQDHGREPAPAVEAAPVDPVAVPDEEVTPPASVSQLGRATRESGSRTVVPASGGLQIPAVALAAYQRAAVVIGAADEGCHLEWPLVAAIGRVESDHGRTGGSALGDNGVAQPAIVGLRLDGKRGTALVSDTDAGRYDGDKAFDRAVGPMQFIPTTWGVVGVDADADGVRDPQDVDDAALATAVYLCSGEVDLVRPADLRRAVHRYNNSERYVDLVLSVMRSYEVGDAVAVGAAGFEPPVGPAAATASGGKVSAQARPAAEPGGRPAAQPAPVREPRPAPQQEPAPTPDAQPVPTADPVVTVLTRAQVVLTCTLRGLSQLLQPARFDACVDELTKG